MYAYIVRHLQKILETQTICRVLHTQIEINVEKKQQSSYKQHQYIAEAAAAYIYVLCFLFLIEHSQHFWPLCEKNAHYVRRRIPSSPLESSLFTRLLRGRIGFGLWTQCLQLCFPHIYASPLSQSSLYIWCSLQQWMMPAARLFLLLYLSYIDSFSQPEYHF